MLRFHGPSVQTDGGVRAVPKGTPLETPLIPPRPLVPLSLCVQTVSSARPYAAGWTRQRDDVRLADSGARITCKPKAAAASPASLLRFPPCSPYDPSRRRDSIAIASTAAFSATQTRPSRTDGQDIKQVIAELEKHAQLFHFSLTSAPDVEWLAGTRATGDIDRFVTSFVHSTRQLRQDHGRGQVVTNRVDEVLRRGASIDSFMEHHRSPNQVQQDWFTVRRDLEKLALAYNVIWNRRAPSSVTT